MSVSRHFKGNVIVTNPKSRHFQSIGQMIGWNWRNSTESAQLKINGDTVWLSVNSVDEYKGNQVQTPDDTNLNSLVRVEMEAGKIEILGPMSHANAVDAARQHKIKNETHSVAIWKLSGHISNPRIVADFIPAKVV